MTFTTLRRMLVAAGALALVPVGAALVASTPAYAHGTMQFPISRGYGCYLDNPESPSLAACQAVVAAQGPQGLYDWMAENILDANGRSRRIVPDGQLCGAGKAEFKGLDLGRSDWPTTSLAAGSTLTMKFIGTAPHKGTFQVYVTHAGYDPRTPLRWSDLQDRPFLTVTDPPLVGGVYQMKATLPAGITGRNLIYTVWQRSDSPEAFYSCSDVLLTGGSSTPGTPPAHPAPTSAPTVAPTVAPSTPPAPRGTGTGRCAPTRRHHGHRAKRCAATPSASIGTPKPAGVAPDAYPTPTGDPSMGPMPGMDMGVTLSPAAESRPLGGSRALLVAVAALLLLAAGGAVAYGIRRRWFGAHRGIQRD